MAMRNYFLLVSIFFIASCKIQPDSNRDNDRFDPDKTYPLRLNPTPGSSYYYDISNETATSLELDDKTMESENKTTAGISYAISKDSAGNFLLNMVYDKIRLYTKNGDTETEMDAANAAGSFNPVEKMLGYLKDARIITTLSPSGELVQISGYEEIGDKILAAFNPADVNGKAMAEARWEKQVGNGLVKGTIDQLFKIFPDSTVRIGDTWRLASKQEGEIPFLIKSTYTLKAINNDIAIIEAKGAISSGNADAMATGMPPGGVAAELEGEQTGQYEMETQTGMLMSCRIKADIEGKIQVMGREVPVRIKTSVSVKGRKLK